MAHVKSVSAKIDRITGSFDKRLPPILDNVDTTSKALPETVERVKSAAENIDKLAQSLNKTVAEDVAPTLKDLRKTVASVQEVTDKQLATWAGLMVFEFNWWKDRGWLNARSFADLAGRATPAGFDARRRLLHPGARS